MRSLHVWQVELLDETTVDMVSQALQLLCCGLASYYPMQALLLESPLGQQLQVLELMDTKLSPWAIGRLARCRLSFSAYSQSDLRLPICRPLGASRLTSIKLDYNQ